jgi:hypothetical protein
MINKKKYLMSLCNASKNVSICPSGVLGTGDELMALVCPVPFLQPLDPVAIAVDAELTIAEWTTSNGYFIASGDVVMPSATNLENYLDNSWIPGIGLQFTIKNTSASPINLTFPTGYSVAGGGTLVIPAYLRTSFVVHRTGTGAFDIY